MTTGAITGYIDVAQLVLYVFWIFFIGLVIYLRREDKREGYPLEAEGRGNVRIVGFPDLPEPKTFTLPHGGGTRTAPRAEEKSYTLAARASSPYPGSPMHPTGNPMVDALQRSAVCSLRTRRMTPAAAKSLGLSGAFGPTPCGV